MSVPAVISNILSKHEIEFDVVETQAIAGVTGEARTTVLQDADGKLQAIYSADSILDIDALCRLTDRELRASSPDDIQSLCAQAQVERLPTVPKALDLSIVIDQRLLEAKELRLDAGSDQSAVTISAEQFQKLIGAAPTGTISVSETELHLSLIHI